MNDFQARFARRFGCTVDVLSGREFDSIGTRAAIGGSCASCGSCSRDVGDVGIAAQGVTIENSVASGIELRWSCPQCGSDTYESTTLLHAASQALGCIADPLCFVCRSKATA